MYAPGRTCRVGRARASRSGGIVLQILKRYFCSLFATAALAAMAAPAFEDSMAQRVMACTACHGPSGRAGPDGYYPRLAGKPAGYLYNQLLNFHEGRRRYGLMAGLLDPLSNAYMMEIAEHFASLDVPYPPPSPSRAPAAVLERGRQLAVDGDAATKVPACVSCHGPALTGVLPAAPGLLGLPRDYINAQLGAWRGGQRRAHEPDCMGPIARQLTPGDVTAVAAWLASQPLPAHAKPAAAQARTSTVQCGTAPLPAGGPRP